MTLSVPGPQAGAGVGEGTARDVTTHRGPSPFSPARAWPHERIPALVLDDHEGVAREVAHRIAHLVRQRAAEGKACVLGLATGSTPIGVYRELIRMHNEEGLSFRHVV